MKTKDIVPTHPGVVMWMEYLEPFGVSRNEIAQATGIPNSRLTEVFAGRRAISADTAIRISRFLGINPQSFINLQAGYDRVMAEIAIERSIPPVKIGLCPKVLAHRELVAA